MSVTFSIQGLEYDLEDTTHDDRWLNVSNVNARDVLEALGIACGDGLIGSVRAHDLEKACVAYLARPTHDDGIPAGSNARHSVDASMHYARFLEPGRRAGYVSEKVEHLLRITRRAGKLGVIRYG
jgi:hypothetical protein